jgi:hypothetical protein
MMTIEQFASALCKDIVLGTFKRVDRAFVATRFSYPVGDSVNIYLIDDGDSQFLSDQGTTNYVLRVAGVDMESDGRQGFIESVCALHGVELTGDFMLRKAVTPETAGDAALHFCEAVTRISTLHYFDRQERRDRTFRDEIDQVLRVNLPKRQVIRNWSDPAIDPRGVWKVDFHLNTLKTPFDVFAITSDRSALSAAATIGYLRSRQRIHKSVSVVAPGVKLPRSSEGKIEMVSRLLYDFDEKPELVVKYIEDQS